MGPPVLRRTCAASAVGVAESGVKSLVSPLLADTCRGGRGEAYFISFFKCAHRRCNVKYQPFFNCATVAANHGILTMTQELD